MKGIGDEIYPLNINVNNLYVIIILPDFSMDTADIYNEFSRDFTGDFRGDFTGNMELVNGGYYLSQEDFINVIHETGNDLFEVACKKYTQLAEIVEIMSGYSLYSGMSGSGSSCFAIYNDVEIAKWDIARMQDIFGKYQMILTEIA